MSGLVDPTLPGLGRYRTTLAESRHPDRVRGATRTFAKHNSGARSAAGVLETGCGNCLGLAALTASLLLAAMPGADDEWVWVVVLGREGQIDGHAIVTYAVETGLWVAIDPANEMPVVDLPEEFAAESTYINWPQLGYPPGVRTRLLFNHEAILFPEIALRNLGAT